MTNSQDIEPKLLSQEEVNNLFNGLVEKGILKGTISALLDQLEKVDSENEQLKADLEKANNQIEELKVHIANQLTNKLDQALDGIWEKAEVPHAD